MSSPSPFITGSRDRFFQEYFQLKTWLENSSGEIWSLQRQQPEPREEVEKLREQHRIEEQRFCQLIQQYKAEVPIVPISRCPYCQAINYHSIDSYDLDGLWWWSQQTLLAVLRRPRERHRLCSHFWSLSGAVRLGTPLTPSPILVKPGAEVPFVFTHILHHSMRVVVSSIAVGVHTAFPIVYYSETKPVQVQHPFLEWSNNAAVLVQENGRIETIFDNPTNNPIYYPSTIGNSSFGADSFDLAPWIQQGQVFWIAPGDESLMLRQAIEGCPYLQLDGRRDRLYIQDGKCWTSART